jgi:hypothetical protein
MNEEEVVALIESINPDNEARFIDGMGDASGLENSVQFLNVIWCTSDFNKRDFYIDKTLITHVESEGGEGQGDYMHVVFQIGEQFFLVPGDYSSYDEDEWHIDDVYEVVPVEVSRTEYHAKGTP